MKTTYKFILDTGAATSVINEDVAVSVDGLIGMDFLRNFRKIKIHFDQQAIETE